MPEGHTVHRVANLFRTLFLTQQIQASSPQGRFHDGAKLLSNRTIQSVEAVGKQLFIGFDHDLVVRVHLGIYGAWDVATLQGGSARAGGPGAESLGAPRVSTARLAERERSRNEDIPFPSPPVGAVRLRLETEDAVADLRGPTACEILTPEQAQAVRSRLGPDPLVDKGVAGQAEFARRLLSTARALGLVLMDQSVVSGIGNVYRAEILFRHRLDPYRPAKSVGAEVAGSLWKDWTVLLSDGVKTGVMLTRDGLDASARARALRNPRERHYVYKRAGAPCRECGVEVVMDLMAARKLYYCPSCQAT
jgi:formamidopyrimidine-DNA glycosylase